METRKRRKRKTDILPITDDYTPKESAIWHCIRGCDAPTFKVDYVSEDIGKGVFALQHFKKGDFLVEYSGELLTRVEAEMRERKYPAKLGSYMYFFQYSGHSYCIDATQYECVGRYVNDATGPQKNAVTRIIEVESKPHIALFSNKSIQKGDEIRYDYGVGNLYWRKKRSKM